MVEVREKAPDRTKGELIIRETRGKLELISRFVHGQSPASCICDYMWRLATTPATREIHSFAKSSFFLKGTRVIYIAGDAKLIFEVGGMPTTTTGAVDSKSAAVATPRLPPNNAAVR